METIPWRRSRGGEAVEARPWRRPRGGAPAGLKIQIFLASRKHVKTLSNIVDFNRFSGPPRGGVRQGGLGVHNVCEGCI